ncbi:cytochrome c family protein [Mesorhizobium sp. M7A.F.Ca.US.001.04.1.1]|uniref:c-type cytochrome n=1 Tax=unclassified Mesorhizobium TaxID=325217 RepID=UPI000FC9A731|nr:MULTISPECIES: cytochrome c family protein [unclassified Mesorhizobium]RUY21807.1 cytochrome c family protein [Mesorhizobium sp. M7A.F.Ca.US.001.04.2.1]RUY34676.1 cytochrome c family protein [Mesorhizobium sp. M7A.F.Ca.US.001.04.1.1]
MKQYPLLATVIFLVVTPAAASAQDVEAGAVVFKKCAVCHAADGVTNKIGPHLGGLIGRTAGTVAGFSYSKAMTAAGAGGLVWNEDTLGKYLVEPKAMVPGTKMAFAGLKKPEDIQNVIAYLKSIPK